MRRFFFLGCLVIAGAARAQTATTPDQPAADAPQSGDIVVTAQLRKQNALDVPIALTAYSGEFLNRLGIYEFDKLGTYTPGLLVQNQSPNNPGFVIRGITSDSGTAFNEPRVSIFQDGVSIAKSRGSYVELFDLDRVEIAKGPQTTLYGRGALIGAINLVEAKADPSAPAMFERLSYGNYNAVQADAMVNLPIGDRAAIRFAGRYKIRDGFVNDDLGGDGFNSTKTGALRAAFHADPTDAISFDVIGNYQHDAPSGTAFKSIAYEPTDPVTGAVIGNRGRNSGAALAPAAGFEDGRNLGLNRNVYSVTGLLKWKLSDKLTLNATTGWRKFHALEVFDADGLSLPILTAAEDARGTQFSQDVRLTYDSPVVTAFVGGSYFHENGSQATPAEFDEREVLARLVGQLNGGAFTGNAADIPAAASVFNNPAFVGNLVQSYVAGQNALLAAAGKPPVVLTAAQATAIGANLQSGHLETSTNYARTNSYDLFGDVTVHITDTLDVGGGLRYTHDHKYSAISASILNGRSPLGGFIGAFQQDTATRDLLLFGLQIPGIAFLPNIFGIPIPNFGLGVQPTANNGDKISDTLSDGGLAFRGTVRWKPTPDTTLYATYARGRRPQVLSVAAPSYPEAAPSFSALPAEKVDSYEAGAKASLLDHKLYVDASAYYYRYHNFQTTVQQGTQFLTSNAGRADSYGVEADITYTPTTWLRLFATYSYNHSRFKTGAFEGDHFRLAPDNAGSLGATGTFAVGDGSFDITPSVTAQSKMFFDDDNDRPDLQQPPSSLVADNIQDEFQKGYALVNLRMGYTFPGGRMRLEAWADNLLAKKYIKDAGNTGDALGLPTFIAGPPRFYGGAFSYKFGGR